MNETQIKVLEAAESEFADNGFAGASIRNITQRAGVNIASVNYHFGSKKALIRQLMQYRVTPLNEYRLRRLREEEADYLDKVVPLPVLIDILVRPALEKMLTAEGAQFVRAMARCMSEPLDFLQSLDREVFQELFMAFQQAFARALPQLNRASVTNQLHFVICAMIGMMLHFPRMESLAVEGLSPENFEEMLDDFIKFITSGIKQVPGA
ncbi:MAG: hypothetical protein CMI18_09130 [Opitutaceae bacterium]|nr:hypothetical protein [Opitutaceae bacterium]|tara:strand:+ start:232 stop:858 length:627 start_codon:yes stop_codon:yes gene_type:complete